MKKLFKKLLAGTLALTATFSLGFMAGCKDDDENKEPTEAEKEADFIESLGGVSETYTGAVSTQAYSTNNDAAEAYVQQEIIGLNKSATIVNTNTVSTLNETQIADLDIPTEEGEEIVSVEEIEVEYTEDESSSGEVMATASAPVSGTLNTSKKVRVYIIKYSDDSFKYYTPAPVTGETITQSYYNSVFNAETYANCTYTSVMDMNIKVTVPNKGSMSIPTVMTQTVQYEADKIYMEQTTSMKIYGITSEETLRIYIEEVDGDLICYANQTIDGETTDWYEAYLTSIGFNSLEELAPFADQYLDYTYFTKTNYGFELSDKNAELYVQQTLSDQLMGSGLENFDISMFAKYYVSEGVLSGMRMDMNMDYSMYMDGVSATASIVAVMEVKISNVGSTVVEKPFTE